MASSNSQRLIDLLLPYVPIAALLLDAPVQIKITNSVNDLPKEAMQASNLPDLQSSELCLSMVPGICHIEQVDADIGNSV